MDALSAVLAVSAARAVERPRGNADTRAGFGAAVYAQTDSQTRLSSAAQLLEALQTVPDTFPDNAVDAQPLLQVNPGSHGIATTLLAQSLQQAFTQSGLFYESHLAEWLQGTRPEELLRAEPQGRLPALPPLADQALAGGTAADGARGAAGLPATGPPGHPSEVPASPAGLPALHEVVDPRAIGLVQQQLQTLDTQVMPWHGQLWPGQAMHWMVEPEADRQHQADFAPPAGGVWNSRLRLALPSLGEVAAELRLSPSGCQLRLRADEGQLARLREALPQLARALGDAGLRTERIVVERHAEDTEGD